MIGRRLFCLHANIDRLSRNGRCYLWTFTLAEATAYTATRVAWNRLLTYLRRNFPSWAGIRVYEVHPGRDGLSHGLHVHVICNRWFSVGAIREISKAAGWGRIHVARVRGGSEYYVAKYLRKRRPEALKGWRLHATFGMPVRTLMADILVQSVRASLMRLVHKWHGGASWSEKQRIVTRWYYRYVSGGFSCAVSAALGSSYYYGGVSGGPRNYRLHPAQFRNSDLSGWGFMRRQTAVSVQAHDPFLTCWGPDLRRHDIIANRAYEKFAAILAVNRGCAEKNRG